MAIITTGNNFGATAAVTSTTLNNIANAATFDDPVDGTSLELKVDGKLGIKDAGVTKAKIENISAPLRVLGRTTAGAGVPEEVTINDEDDMANASAITLATDESIKAYVDTATPRRKYVQLTGGTHGLSSGNQSAGTLTYNIGDFTSSDVDFTTSAITAIIIQGYVGSDTEQAVSINATVPSGQEINIGYLQDFGTNTNKGRTASTATLPINEGQSSFDVIYTGGTACESTIFGAIIN